jgi:UPF0176 protein
MSQPVKILLYYKYVTIANPQELKHEQKALCQNLGLKGRILVSTEGINGTVAGEETAINEYMEATKKIPELADMEWKISWAEEQVFPKLRVVVRDEIVTLGIKKTSKDVSLENKAQYIEPEELLKLYENNEDFVIIDARNGYEAEIGKFKNSITPSIENFRDFPLFVKQELAKFKDKKVVTYCTGGVRCEKASAYLREQGFKDVQQLHGGIHEYGEKTGGKHFEGEMFVFDKRLHLAVNQVNPTVISNCQYCQAPVTRYIDCVAFGCPSLFICCEQCQKEHRSACSEKCEQTLKNQVNKSVTIV